MVCLAAEIAGIRATSMWVDYYPPVRMAIYLGNNTPRTQMHFAKGQFGCKRKHVLKSLKILSCFFY
nr:MAG TPA: hypothetical protein [Caudoviricetes sp.]